MFYSLFGHSFLLTGLICNKQYNDIYYYVSHPTLGFSQSPQQQGWMNISHDLTSQGWLVDLLQWPWDFKFQTILLVTHSRDVSASKNYLPASRHFGVTCNVDAPFCTWSSIWIIFTATKIKCSSYVPYFLFHLSWVDKMVLLLTSRRFCWSLLNVVTWQLTIDIIRMNPDRTIMAAFVWAGTVRLTPR